MAAGLDRLASGKAVSALKRIDPETAAKLEATERFSLSRMQR